MPEWLAGEVLEQVGVWDELPLVEFLADEIESEQKLFFYRNRISLNYWLLKDLLDLATGGGIYRITIPDNHIIYKWYKILC